MYRSAPIVVFVLWVLWKGLGEKELLSLLDDGAVLFHSLLCFPFFYSFVVGFFGRTRWVLGGEFSSLGGFILV